MIDRRHFCGALAAAGVVAGAGGPAWGSGGSIASFTVREPTEIGWIIAGLSPLGRSGGGVIRRDGPYFAAVERWFAPVAAHPAITSLGADFNLPRLVGNAADYRFDRAGRLLRSRNAVALWDDADGDLFTRHLAKIEAFSRASDAREFLRVQRPALAASDHLLHAEVDMRDMQAWLESQFTARPAPVQIFVSPLTDGWNWTNLGGRTPRIWAPAPRPGSFDDAVRRFTVVASVFTELDHIYVNPMTRLNLAAVETAFAKGKGWASEAAWADYASAELVFNEYMTWGVFLEYARERLSPADYDTLQMKMVRFMENRRGFLRFGSFIGVLRQVRTASAQKLHEAFPVVISRLT